MNRLITMTSLLALGFYSFAAHASDATRGAQLHQQQCTACHASRLGFGNNGNDIYSRSNRRVQSLAGLTKQVNRCKNNLQIVWFDEDVNDVVEFLNGSFYHFGKE